MDTQSLPQSELPTIVEGFCLIPTNLVSDPARPLRSDLTPEKVEDLVLSIKQMGIIEPLIVRPKGNRFEVIAGHRRLIAAQIAQLKEIPCIIKKLGDEESEVMKIHENLYREDISPPDEAKHFDYLIQHLKLSPAKVAQLVGRSPTYVSERLAIFNYPPELRQALIDKKIVFSVAREFARHPDPHKIREFLRYAISNGITPTLARQWVQDDIRAREQRPQSTTPGSGEIPSAEQEKPYYTCILCREGIEVQNLTVTYMHDNCHREITKATEPTPSAEQNPDSVPLTQPV